MKRTVLLITAMSVLWVLPLSAQDSGTFSKFTFSLGTGITTPLNPTAQYTGVSGNFAASLGYKLSNRQSVNGEFLYSGLPGSVYVIQPVKLPTVSSNVYYLGANYRYQVDRIGGSVFGIYGIVGGGWYDRYITVDQTYIVPAGTPCVPIWTWWGYACDSNGYVSSYTVAKKGGSTGGFNGGFGFSIALGGGKWKFFSEARYHYAFNENVPTTMIPVTLGIRYR